MAGRSFRAASKLGRRVLRTFLWIQSLRHRDAVTAPDINTAQSLRLLAVGRQGYGNLRTLRIALSMERAARSSPTHGVLYLGDNFYPKGVQSVTDPQWQYKFERLYSGPHLLGMPFFAVVGNHDAEGVIAAQLEYARRRCGTARWRMEGPGHVRDFGKAANGPLVRAVFLDSVALHRDPAPQLDILHQAFDESCPAVWRMVVSHYGFRSLTNEPYTRRLTLTHLLPVLRQLRVDLCATANDRFQQVIDRPGEPLHLSANGGGDMAEAGLTVEDPERDFVSSQGGFAIITFSQDSMAVELRSVSGGLTYERRRAR